MSLNLTVLTGRHRLNVWDVATNSALRNGYKIATKGKQNGAFCSAQHDVPLKQSFAILSSGV